MYITTCIDVSMQVVTQFIAFNLLKLDSKMKNLDNFKNLRP